MRNIALMALALALALAGCTTRPAPVDSPCGVLNAARYSLEPVQGKTRVDQRRLDVVVARGKAAGCWT